MIKLYAIITGASSGIGLEITKILAKEYDLILVSRNTDSLVNIKNKFKERNIIIESLDLTKIENVHLLYEKYKNYDIDVLVNNAGFGKIGFLEDLNVNEGEDMIRLNVLALYSLTHMFIKIVKSHILNIGSLAGFMPGPKMANYYATKSYVLSFSRAINYENKRLKRKLRISTLCPGPVKTNFNMVAKGEFKSKGLKADKVALKAIKNMKKNKEIIYPSFSNRMLAIFSKIIPHSLLFRLIYNNQNSK